VRRHFPEPKLLQGHREKEIERGGMIDRREEIAGEVKGPYFGQMRDQLRDALNLIVVHTHARIKRRTGRRSIGQ
jgi:hypothetical protein